MYSYEELVGIIAELRSDHGCPWDKAQTHESMISCLRNECEEVVEAIEQKDPENLCEVKKAGAAGGCIMSGWMQCEDVREYLKCLKHDK